ncbi:MAG TPA: hypothetical protein VEW93_01255 [Acidimicrobiales bacterium]|nr:hypothetical protein [Acidimicrobiales bacterium]
MGQPIVVVEKPSVANPGMVRFETNRALTGMGHERYVPGEVRGDRPPDELARRLLARGGIVAIHINGSVVTVDLVKGHGTDGLREIIEGLYIHYPPTADGDEAVLPDGDQPTSEGELVETVVEAADDAPAPQHEPARPAAEVAAEELASAADDTGEPAAPSAGATVEADEVADADVQQVEGDAPTVDQSPVDAPGTAPPDDASEPGPG